MNPDLVNVKSCEKSGFNQKVTPPSAPVIPIPTVTSTPLISLTAETSTPLITEFAELITWKVT